MIRQLRLATLILLVIAALGLSGCSGFQREDDRGGTPKRTAPAKKPNIVFVLTDDLSWNLIEHMPQVRGMQRDGLTFDNFLVADSLCCTSRATIFTGRYPHNTGVRTNFPPDGGYQVFKAKGGEQASFAPLLQRAGYRTALLGKYMNGYQPNDAQGGGRPYVPPGWNEWYVAGNGYPEFNYDLNENGRLVHYGDEPQDYLTDVLANKGLDFIRRAHASAQPFIMEISTFAPHGPFVPAPRHAGAFPTLRAPRSASFNEADVGDKPSWLRSRPRMGKPRIRRIDAGFRDRVRMVQSVDEMIGRIRTTLKELGRDRDTYVVFGSDNGFHMGEHRLAGGKMTAYDTDVRVPYIVTGPNVPAGHRVEEVAQNTDLAPTFLELAGVRPPPATDGRSLVPFLRGTKRPDWRQTALIEHVKPPPSPEDPDRQDSAPGAPTTYNAIRNDDLLYVEYASGEREYYDRRRDPHELDNIFGTLPEQRRRYLSNLLDVLAHCSGVGCTSAGRSR
ncbi:arylsulfatase A-like enzyme [Actinomadura pelletieri DSM 43383]|uniref:Arylsulfatase A-like enzyme n=1 Tax=Actinomadura pelletieri DSM 43383 TaxID=1120940 RepID=A0A495QGZ1_9ACTN|nr:sulfatase [Actinomadura pelletieri]RKS71135.1 arylsulfatase A-like enzyme [Actinomadura pelletieri DSM 43383]